MKVIIGIPCLFRGGTEMQTLYLARALVEGGHEVEVVSYFEHDPEVVGEFEASGSAVALMNLERNIGVPAIIGSLRTYFAGRRPDVVHVQYMAPGSLPVIAARLAGVEKVLATVHQPFTRGHGKHAMILLRFSALLCNHFLAVSAVAERSWFGASAAGSIPAATGKHPRHFTLHNTVDVAEVERLVSESPGSRLGAAADLEDGFVFGYVGRVRYEKGLDILLDAFAAVTANRHAVQLLVVGDGPDLAVLKERYEKESWWWKVLFAGPQSWEDAIRHFSLMDSVVVPSRFEGFGLTAIEAMAAARPVIASDTGGLGEIIAHEKTGMLFANGCVGELGEAMTKLLDDDSLRRRLAAGARKRAGVFDVGSYNEKVISFYRSLER